MVFECIDPLDLLKIHDALADLHELHSLRVTQKGVDCSAMFLVFELKVNDEHLAMRVNERASCDAR
jgi:hypothetical protein